MKIIKIIRNQVQHTKRKINWIISKKAKNNFFTIKKNSVKFLLSNLPKPSNKYEIDFTDNTENLIKEIE